MAFWAQDDVKTAEVWNSWDLSEGCVIDLEAYECLPDQAMDKTRFGGKKFGGHINQSSVQRVGHGPCEANLTTFYRGTAMSVSRKLGWSMLDEFLSEDEKVHLSQAYEMSLSGVLNGDSSVQVCDLKTKNRHSVWMGVMPFGDAYDESVASPVALNSFGNKTILKILSPHVEVLRREATGDAQLSPFMPKIKALHLVDYTFWPTWKITHFDGRYLTDHKELYGFTLDSGKRMCVGTTMTLGEADNKWNVIEIPPWSLYRVSALGLDKQWHGVLRTAKRIRTVMLRAATISLGCESSKKKKKKKKRGKKRRCRSKSAKSAKKHKSANKHKSSDETYQDWTGNDADFVP